jgi:hypothetical protein
VDGVVFTETMQDTQAGKANLTVMLKALANQELQGTYFTLSLPRKTYGAGTVEFLDATGKTVVRNVLTNLTADMQASAKRVRVTAG